MSISKDKLSAMQNAFSDQSNVFADAIKSSENVKTKEPNKEPNKKVNKNTNRKTSKPKKKVNKNTNRKTSKPKKKAKRKAIKMPVATKDNKVIKSYSLEPDVADKIAELAKKQGFKNASAFVNAVFKQA